MSRSQTEHIQTRCKGQCHTTGSKRRSECQASMRKISDRCTRHVVNARFDASISAPLPRTALSLSGRRDGEAPHNLKLELALPRSSYVLLFFFLNMSMAFILSVQELDFSSLIL